MTLQPYTPDRADQLALRLLDVSSRLRALAQRARDEGLELFQLHDKKALEWLGLLEEWSQRSMGDVDAAIRKEHGARRAREVAAKY
jgi:hypothetical protein